MTVPSTKNVIPITVVVNLELKAISDMAFGLRLNLKFQRQYGVEPRQNNYDISDIVGKKDK